MKNVIFVLATALILASCGEKTVETAKVDENIDKMVVVDAETVESDFPNIDNPSLFGGSGFGGYINSLYKMGRYDEMITFTSKSSLEKFGKENVKDFYQNKLKFGFELGGVKSISEEDGVKVINYPNASVMPTRKEGKTIRIAYTIENDSCKLVLTDLVDGFFK
jgi:hypothetical protein